MSIRITISGAKPEDLDRGVKAVEDFFRAVGISADEAAWGAASREAWHLQISCGPAPDENGSAWDIDPPTPANQCAATAWDEANNVAIEAACAGWPAKPQSADLNVRSPQAGGPVIYLDIRELLDRVFALPDDQSLRGSFVELEDALMRWPLVDGVLVSTRRWSDWWQVFNSAVDRNLSVRVVGQTFEDLTARGAGDAIDAATCRRLKSDELVRAHVSRYKPDAWTLVSWDSSSGRGAFRQRVMPILQNTFGPPASGEPYRMGVRAR